MGIKSYIMYNPEFDIIHHCAICVGNALKREFECLQLAMGEPWITIVLDEDWRDYPYSVLQDKCRNFAKR